MSESHDDWRRPLLTVSGVALVAVGIGLGALLWRMPEASPTRVDAEVAAPVGGERSLDTAMPSPVSETMVMLTREMVVRAGIQTAVATSGAITSSVRIPGVVQPNGYKEVAVTPLMSGRITQVSGELGQRVTAGQVLATVYSPELVEAQTAYIATNAEHIAHTTRQARTRRLVAIGAASRQELEGLDADEIRLEAALEASRTRLILLGMPEERITRLTSKADMVTIFDVPAPLAGVITKRSANPGLNIDPTTPLFTVVDLSTVWVMADLYERDFARVRVGSLVTITTPAYPGLAVEGRVSYIDPQVQDETRTAKLRVEVPNPTGRLRFGMYVDASVGQPSTESGVMVPRTAVQVVGSQSVVYVTPDAASGHFVERKVELGGAVGDQVRVVQGVQAGETVVTDGAFFLRAERERTGTSATGSLPTPEAVAPAPATP